MINSNLTTIGIEREKRRRYYPEVFTKTDNRKQKPHFANNYRFNKELFETVLNAGQTLSCTVGYLKSRPCPSGNSFVKAIFCGREYCDNCGRDGSPAHLRRIARWLPKAEQIKNMAYVVITIPEEARKHFKSKKALTAFRTYVKRKLQRDGYKRGLIRWHWFGDCHQCKGAGCFHCNQSGMSAKYHPHLNILTDGGKINKKQFETYFKTWRQDLENYFNKVTGKKDNKGNIKYLYTDRPEIRAHWLKYVTRATHKNFNKEVATTLAGYRTTSSWGTWQHKTDVKTENSTLIALERNLCPCCKALLTWEAGSYEINPETNKRKFKRKLLSVKELKPDKIKHLNAGYYIINP